MAAASSQGRGLAEGFFPLTPALSMNLPIANCQLPIANCLEGRGSWSQCAVDKPWRLSMNRPAYGRRILDEVGEALTPSLFMRSYVPSKHKITNTLSYYV